MVEPLPIPEFDCALDGSIARPTLIDPFGREITYLRVSVTDRCDFRCVYCMNEHMAFFAEGRFAHA